MLEVRGLTVSYGEHVAVRDVTLSAADGEVLCVLGPSGCGKSTLLRAVAGLEQPDAGSIHLDGHDLGGRRPDQRGVGLMFQEHTLFPHRSVGDNVAFGPRMRRVPAADVATRVRDALALVDLAGMQDRRIDELSGGERQRVALARSIAPRPRLLMLDEPLGSLDRALRDRLLEDLPRVFAELGTTVVYVTHDQTEALVLADRIAVMRAGRVEQVGAPDRLWREPRSAFVARFLGLEHVLDAEVAGDTVRTALGELPVTPDDLAAVADATAPLRLVLLPDALRLTDELRPPVPPDELAVPGRVVARRFAGDHLRVRIRTRSEVVLHVPVWRGAGPQVGDRVELALDVHAVRLVPDDEAAPSPSVTRELAP